jgi:hypothetical protein
MCKSFAEHNHASEAEINNLDVVGAVQKDALALETIPVDNVIAVPAAVFLAAFSAAPLLTPCTEVRFGEGE